MKTQIVPIGNLRGIRIPKPLLEQTGLSGEVMAKKPAFILKYADEVKGHLRAIDAKHHSEIQTETFTPVHRIGGHADCVQSPMELECQLVTNGLYCGNATGFQDPRAETLASGAADWRLLLQIDSDDNAGMMWGDCGRLYFWIREDDLQAKAFDKSWMILQCS